MNMVVSVIRESQKIVQKVMMPQMDSVFLEEFILNKFQPMEENIKKHKDIDIKRIRNSLIIN